MRPQVEICKREDGTDWLLGAGSYGKVTVVYAPCGCPMLPYCLLCCGYRACMRAPLQGPTASGAEEGL